MSEQEASNADRQNRTQPRDDEAATPFRYVHSLSLPRLLQDLRCSLLVTTYQAGKLAVVRARGKRISMLPRTFEQAMGVAVSPHRLAVGTQHQIWILDNSRQLGRSITPGRHPDCDACFIPRRSHVTGNIQIHEMAWGESLKGNVPELWYVNTLFNCLSTLDGRYSFYPRWRPPFITGLAPQDRCHLNGVAMLGNKPKYVTAFAETDEPGGWRSQRAKGGCVIDVESNQTVVRGLAMPHSPRCYNNKLYVLDSGTGRIVVADPDSGQLGTVATLPGYTRGLALHQGYAFVGLSRIRDNKTFDEVPITDRRDELKCGVWVVDLRTGSVVGLLEFQQDVAEIFDVQLIPGVLNPSVIGLQKETIQGVFEFPK